MQSKYAKIFKALLIYKSFEKKANVSVLFWKLTKKLQNKGKIEELET